MSEATPAPEEWRPVVGFEGKYEVSSLGRVRGLDRFVTVPRGARGPYQKRWRGRMLTPHPASRGYLQVQLGSRAGKRNFRYVHTLVAEAFHGLRPPGMEVCHGPGGITDNRAVNLSWGTPGKNRGPDRRRDGTDFNGGRAPFAKLTWEQVDEIRRRLPPGLPHGQRPAHLRHIPTQAQLAAEYRVSREMISMIVAGKTWRPEFRDHASSADGQGAHV